MKWTFIALGSNVGSRICNCCCALQALSKKGCIVEGVSPWFLSEPLGIPQPWFINAVAQICTPLPPLAFLKCLQGIERQMGRVEKGTGAPRIIDLDIVFYDQLVLFTPELSLPHPRFRERRFVLLPLSTIAPRYRDPLTGYTVEELLKRCQDTSRVIPLIGGERSVVPWTGCPSALPQRLPPGFWHHQQPKRERALPGPGPGSLP